jgi:hypothetical protein
VLLLVAAAVGAGLAFEPVSRWYVLREAARRGVTLTPREMKVEWGRVSFFDVGVALDGVPDLALEAAYLEVRADALVPREALVRGVVARARSMDAVRQVLDFGRRRESELVPVRATDVRLALAPATDAADAPAVIDVALTTAALLPGEPVRAGAVRIDIPRPRATVGPVDLVLSAKGNVLDVALGVDPKASPLRATADLDARALSLVLVATPAQTLAGWFGRKQAPGAPPWPGAFSVQARADARWSADLRGDLTGKVDATLIGLVPPHPAELSGIVFGSDTRASLDFRARPSESAIALERLEVAVGSLRLTGTGKVVPRGDSFAASADLRGAIPCAELIGSAASAHLGLSIGAGLGGLARAGVAGSVEVRLSVAVDGEAIARPDVRPSASIHCRLRIPGL